ncbi:MAG TPA: capsular biosynthesis protein [Candidatus Cloacimonadota bacterium]|nr:capsular biosynthesis protein [Candidatus Cloacimonadota bacterium]
MIDIHCHLLPNIDDGSRDIESSIEQAGQMSGSGITRAYLTSHYFRGHYHYPRADYDTRLKELQQALDQHDIGLKLESGFEIFIQPGILKDIDEHHLTMGNSKYILIESELNGLPTDFYDNVYPLLRAGYKPILAHAERYVSIMKKPSRARELVDKNIYLQTNAGALLGQYGEKVRQTAWTLIDNGWTHFIASDDHVRMPYTNMQEAYELLSERIDDHTARLLTTDFPAYIESGDKLPYAYVQVRRPRHHHKRSWLKRLFD